MSMHNVGVVRVSRDCHRVGAASVCSSSSEENLQERSRLLSVSRRSADGGKNRWALSFISGEGIGEPCMTLQNCSDAA